MTLRICLRCDWEEDGRDVACPNCGVPLYVIAAPSSGRTVETVGGDHEERGLDAAGTEGASGSPARSTRSVGALVLVGLTLTIAAGSWLGSREESRSSAASTRPATGPSPVDESSPSSPASASPAPTGVGPIGFVSSPARRMLNLGGVPFSFRVRASGWESFGDISINKSIVGPQGAEAIVFWTSFPDGDIAEPCPDVLGHRAGRSTDHLANALAAAPGTELVAGPSDARVGGLPARHVVVIVREHGGCEPGYFFVWEEAVAGAFWRRTGVGSTIRVWVVDVGGTLIVIQAATHREADAVLVDEVRRIIRSIRFEA